jgi:hypothetical protein
VVVTVTVAVERYGGGSGEGAPGDLSARYQDYLERKIASIRATRQTYSDVLDRIASGDLDPRVLDRGLNWFWNAYGPDHAVAIAELVMRFLAQVVQLTCEQGRDLVEDLVPGADPPGLAKPPDVDVTDWMSWLTRLVEYADNEQSAQLAALRSALEQTADADADADTGTREPSAATMVTRLAALCFDVLAALDDVNAQLGKHYIDTVVPDDGPQAIELSGASGEQVECRLVVSNDQADTATVQCTVTDVRREDGIGPAFEPATTISPPDLRLPPNGSALVTCSIRLTDLFTAQATYVGELSVAVDTEPVLQMPVRIRVTDDGRST